MEWLCIDEIFPGYIAPAFQAISVFCLSLPKNQIGTNIFGGAQPFEGLGFLNLSGDWALVGLHGPLYTPLSAQVSSSLLFFLDYHSHLLITSLTCWTFPYRMESR
jgi:hypothetical protein